IDEELILGARHPRRDVREHQILPAVVRHQPITRGEVHAHGPFFGCDLVAERRDAERRSVHTESPLSSSWRDSTREYAIVDDMTDTAPCYLFLDCDRFYFAVEAAERPGLADDPRPVIIGRDPRTAPRRIVTTANDPARALGIRSGLSAAIALRLAPNALFLPPRHELYARYSTRVMAVLRDESPLVEQHSIDEAACLWPHGFGPEPPLALRARVLAETGISVSLGLATSPLVAKMASEAAKKRADHLCIVIPGAEAAFLSPLPVRALV